MQRQKRKWSKYLTTIEQTWKGPAVSFPPTCRVELLFYSTAKPHVRNTHAPQLSRRQRLCTRPCSLSTGHLVAKHPPARPRSPPGPRQLRRAQRAPALLGAGQAGPAFRHRLNEAAASGGFPQGRRKTRPPLLRPPISPLAGGRSGSRPPPPQASQPPAAPSAAGPGPRRVPRQQGQAPPCVRLRSRALGPGPAQPAQADLAPALQLPACTAAAWGDTLGVSVPSGRAACW